MRIVRFVAEDGKIYQGVPLGSSFDTAAVIEGDIYADFSVSRKESVISKLLPPVTPPNIYALGLNYRKHADETGISYPEVPVVFIKASTSLNGPDGAIVLPNAGPDEVDYEGELAVVIGRKGKNIAESAALEHVLGYTCANDITARDWQNRLQKKQWARGKSFDTFCPIGPCIVTGDEVGDPNRLRIETRLNGKVVQNSSTADMIFTVQRIICDLSRSITLLPGTLILTGTPEGVGFTRQPALFLKKGDRVTVSIEKIGELHNAVETEK